MKMEKGVSSLFMWENLSQSSPQCANGLNHNTFNLCWVIGILVVCLGLFIALKCVKSQNQLPFYTMKFFHQLVSSQCYRRTSSHWWSRMNGSTNCILGHKYAIETIQIFHLRHNYATKPVLLLDCGLKIKTPVVFCGGFVTVHKPFENWQSEK